MLLTIIVNIDAAYKARGEEECQDEEVCTKLLNEGINGEAKGGKKKNAQQRKAIEFLLRSADGSVAIGDLVAIEVGDDQELEIVHMISMALTKPVKRNGSISVRYSKWAAMPQTKAAAETKVSNQ